MERGVPRTAVEPPGRRVRRRRRREPQTHGAALRRRDVIEGQTLLIPRNLHMALTVVTFVFFVLGTIPGWLLWKYAIAFPSALLSLLGLPGAVMAAQAISRRRTRILLKGEPSLFMNTTGPDYLAGSFAVVSFVGAFAYALNFTLALTGCTTRTVESLCTMTCSDLVVTNTTDWSTIMTVPFFSTNIQWQNICIDDYALTIFYTIVGYLCAIVSLIVLIYEFRLRVESQKILLRHPRQPPAVVVAASTIAEHQAVPMPSPSPPLPKTASSLRHKASLADFMAATPLISATATEAPSALQMQPMYSPPPATLPADIIFEDGRAIRLKSGRR